VARRAPRALQQVTERSMVLGRLPLYGEQEASPDCSQASSLSAEEIVVVYHERTKHHYHRFAASVGYMDWLRSQIRSVVTTERRWFASLSPRWGKHFHTGSSTSPTAWNQPRFRLTPSRCSSATPSR
jgi:hypothetical protein